MSPIKVLGVSGSPRKGRNTGSLLQAVLDAAQEARAETELLSLAGLSHGGAEQVAEHLARFGMMHGMVVVGGLGTPSPRDTSASPPSRGTKAGAESPGMPSPSRTPGESGGGWPRSPVR